MFRTIILERIDSLGVENFKSFSKVKEFYDKPRNEILKVIRNFEIIVIKSTIKIDEEFLKHYLSWSASFQWHALSGG